MVKIHYLIHVGPLGVYTKIQDGQLRSLCLQLYPSSDGNRWRIHQKVGS